LALQPAAKMPVHRKESTVVERTQALTLHAAGSGYDKIEAITGIKKDAFKAMLRRAKSRGYVPGDAVKEAHVVNTPRPGQPKVITPEIGAVVEAVLTKNSTTREYSSDELEREIAKRLAATHPHAKAPSRRTILRWLRKEGYRSVKHTTKPVLNKAQRLVRLEFALSHSHWTLEDWKKVVWSDETSVVLGQIRGKRRIWRLPKERYDKHVTKRRHKGYKSFMFWACFSWYMRGPCYCWPDEKKAMTKKYQAQMDAYNKAHEAEDRQKWELETAMRRMRVDRNMPGKKPVWKYSKETGKQVRGEKHKGIDWKRYQEEVLKPRFAPFMDKLTAAQPGIEFLVQEDNAAAHKAQWNRKFWKGTRYEKLEWPPNSPDLNAIEPPWMRIKEGWRKKTVPSTRIGLEREWRARWRSYPLEKLQRFVERIQGNLQWVIRLAGGNEYKEGSVPPELEEGEEEPGVVIWREWLRKTRSQREEEIQITEATLEEDLEEVSGILSAWDDSILC